MLMMFEKRAAVAWGTKHFSRRCSRVRVSPGFKWGLCLERTGLRSHSGVDIALDSESKGRGFESHCDQSLCSPFFFFFSFRIYFRYFLTSGFTESVVFFMDFWLNEWRIFWGNAANADPERLVLEFACSLSSVLSHGKCFGVSFFSIPVHTSLVSLLWHELTNKLLQWMKERVYGSWAGSQKTESSSGRYSSALTKRF